MEWHFYCKMFPVLEDDALRELADDIRENGLRSPIVIDDDNQILDGRNRQAACLIVGVKPVYETFVGSESDKLAYVASLNLHRRHLDENRRAKIAAELANTRNGRPKTGSTAPVTTADAARALNVSEASVKRSRKIKQHGVAELQAAVDNNEVSLSAAAKVADKPADEQRRIVEDAKASPKKNRGPRPFDLDKAADRLCDLLHAELKRWPSEHHREAAQWIRQVMTDLDI